MEEKETRRHVLRQKDEVRLNVLYGLWLILFFGWFVISIILYFPRIIGSWLSFSALGKFPLNAVVYISLWLIWLVVITFALRLLMNWLRSKDDFQ